jgi:hypothetical protein
MEKPVLNKQRHITLSLTAAEAAQIVTVLDIATQAGGIMAARAALPLAGVLKAKLAETPEGPIEWPLIESECEILARLFNTAIQVRGLAVAEFILALVDRISAELQSAIIPASNIIPLSPKE